MSVKKYLDYAGLQRYDDNWKLKFQEMIISDDDLDDIWEDLFFPPQFNFTVNTAATKTGEKTTGIPFNLYEQTGIELTVDWGDNTQSILTSSDYTSNDCTASVHVYDAAGEYTITVYSNDWENTYLFCMNKQLSSSSNADTPLYWFRRTLTSVNKKIPKIKGMYLYVPATQSKPAEYSTFNNSLKGCFIYCSALRTIPSKLFVNNTTVTDFSNCFAHCYFIQSIPSGLFDKNTAATNFNSCFYYCSSLISIPSGLFDKNTTATNFSWCFGNCHDIQSIPSGLFDNNTAVTNFSGCFQECISLESIPSGLFEHNTAVTSIEHCFNGCSSLASIPSGLFDNCTLITSFNNCFYQCFALASIPSGLFDHNTAVTDFSECFYQCFDITAIPPELFRYNTAVTTFNGCFHDCALLSIPENLFLYNTAVRDFEYCFYGCDSLGDFTLRIGSSSVSYASNFLDSRYDTIRTIYVPSNSTTYTTFMDEEENFGIITIIGV